MFDDQFSVDTMPNQPLAPSGSTRLQGVSADEGEDDAEYGVLVVSDEEEPQTFQSDGSSPGRRKLHICPICKKSYPRPSRLKEHLKIHAAEKLYSCSVCGKSFSTTTNLRAHEKTHMADKPHPCTICPKSFLRPCLLKKHMKIHVRDGLIAEPADSTSKVEEEAEEEESAEREVEIKEEEGNPEEQSPDGWSRLSPANHTCLDSESFVLNNEDGDVSGLINSDGEEEDWKQAVNTVSDKDKRVPEDSDSKPRHCCPVCGRDCQKASALQKHLRIHSGERPYQCPTCKKSFTQQVHMTEHQRIHTGEKPYTCNDCGKSFTFSSALRRHQRLHNDDRPYQCPLCQKSFKQQSSLKSHQMIHSGVRFQCPFCSKSFSRALELNYHVGMHSKARPYFCDICKKNLSGARIFRNHMKKHELGSFTSSSSSWETQEGDMLSDI